MKTYTTITGVNGVGMQLQRYSPIAMKLSSMPLITALYRSQSIAIENSTLLIIVH